MRPTSLSTVRPCLKTNQNQTSNNKNNRYLRRRLHLQGRRILKMKHREVTKTNGDNSNKSKKTALRGSY